jgi:ubiquitin C-terminal hydrolase
MQSLDQYELLAVVNHHGDINGGHYTSFVRSDQRWFKCNDARITEAAPEEVRRSQG